MKRWLGLDLIDTAIHVFVTICAGVVFTEIGGPVDEEIGLGFVFGTSAILFAIRRRLALRRDPGMTAEEMAAERMAELEARVADLELAQDRVAQLEERMDFSERLLVQGRGAAALEERQSRDS